MNQIFYDTCAHANDPSNERRCCAHNECDCRNCEELEASWLGLRDPEDGDELEDAA